MVLLHVRARARRIERDGLASLERRVNPSKTAQYFIWPLVGTPARGVIAQLPVAAFWRFTGNSELISRTPDRAITSGLPTTRELALLWFAFQRLANREQEDGTLVLCVRRKELNYIIVEEG